MTGKELLNNLNPNLRLIGSTIKIFNLYLQIQESLIDFDLIDFFYQIKKNDRGDGLALEILLFDDELLHDIVITRTNIDHVTVLKKSITTALIRTSFGENVNEMGETSAIDSLTFTISIGGDVRALSYVSDTKKFADFQRIKTNLLKVAKL